MELIMISQSRLKIMLSADDMQKYSLGTEIDYSDSVTRRAFRNILREAKEKTGFCAETEKIYVQFYPSKKGGCELYITKITDECDYMDLEYEETAKDRQTKLPEHSFGFIPPRKHTQRERRRAFSFNSAEHLIAVCKRLLSIKWNGKSSAYKGTDGKFHLMLLDRTCSSLSALDRLSFITEYGKSESFAELEIYLLEHGETVCRENAVEKLGVL